ncbi:MAG: sigma-70 family RNA polymerase sigma factor [Candidatus Rokubacteria bacterium]|nr:sigma-70 family RNA polymerase sigma factor [Candidatus Rokubacteria bacterium]
MPPETRSDEMLMDEVRAGSPAAFEALYDRHHRSVFAFLLRSLGERRKAEDLLQETFLRVFAHREGYRPTAGFRTWLFTIARNLLVDELRRRSGARALEGAELAETLTDPGATPLERAEAGELGERLQAAMLELPPSQREVVLLGRFGGLSAKEVAEITGASPGAVRVTLHRALRRLRDLLGEL